MERFAQPDDRPRDLIANDIRVDGACKSHIDLDDIGLKVGQHVESRMPGAEIVDCRDHSVAPVFYEDVLQVTDVARRLIFGDLEHQMMQRESGLLGRLERLGQARCRLVHRIREKIDAEQGAHLELRCQCDGLDPAGLVKCVAVMFGDLAQDVMGGSASDGTHQRLIGIYVSGFDIHDGLKCHGEIRHRHVGSTRVATDLLSRHIGLRSMTVKFVQAFVK